MSWYYNNEEWKKHCECGCNKHKRCSFCDCLMGLFGCFCLRKHDHDKRCCCHDDKHKRNPWDKCIY